ncbi:hypothetical protein E2562_036954 [Oryza meyeriana var. granulata]|uniref:Uncharacterized protein n=1 Tax=Oryza meyeriana var. granulata TaxID=110450 RepID=A0A6G1CA98_9ORYZ|nr:hypothetical protein E2562_036954 [Oryza meyeriana var. granulata]
MATYRSNADGRTAKNATARRRGSSHGSPSIVVATNHYSASSASFRTASGLHHNESMTGDISAQNSGLRHTGKAAR